MFSAVRRSISRAFSSATASWLATARSSSSSSLAERPLASGGQHAERRVARLHRQRQQRAVAAGGLPRRGPPARAADEVEQRGRSLAGRPRRRAVGRIGGDELEPAAVGVELVELAELGPEQPAHPLGHGAVELVAARDRRDPLAERGEQGQRLDAPARLLVEAGVLDRAGHERRGVAEEGRARRSSNSRGATVCSTTTPSTSPERAGTGTATIDWKCSSSISGTYFMRGSVSASSRMNAGALVRATQPVRPSSTPHSSRPTRWR